MAAIESGQWREISPTQDIEREIAPHATENSVKVTNRFEWDRRRPELVCIARKGGRIA